MKFQPHPYHLVEPSPWPLAISIALLTTTVSAVCLFHGYAHAGVFTIIGLLAIISAMGIWWADVIREGTFLGHHTIRVQQGLMMGIILFVVSEVFFFLSIFWAFFDSALAPTVELGCSWPPAGIQPIEPWELPLVNTVLLLSSGFTVTWSHHSLIAGDRKNAILALVYTVVLALVFTGIQLYEYYNATFTISDGAFGSCFFFGTGFHGFHVLVGTIFLSVGLYRMINYHLTKHHHVGYEGAIIYWHFVDVVWLLLYIFFYQWGGGEPPFIQNSPQVLVKQTEQEFSLIKEEYLLNSKVFKTENDSKVFRSLINGLFQAEGHIGAYFPYKDSLKLQFVLALGQNYSKEAAILLLKLQNALGGIGQFKLELASTGTVHIKFVITKASDILNVAIPYLNQLYGQKALNLTLFNQIFNLYNLANLRENPQSALELVHLVYSLSPDGNQRRITLQQKLTLLGLSLNEVPALPSLVENFNLPSIPFILGFWLGDGTLGVTLDDPPARYPMVYVKLYFSLYQKSSSETLHLFSLFTQALSPYFKVKVSSNSSGMTNLSVSGRAVAELVIPFLSKYSDMLYWKTNQFSLTSKIATLILNKDHLSKEGLLRIVSLIYSSSIIFKSSRKEPKEYFIQLIEQAFPAGAKSRGGLKDQ